MKNLLLLLVCFIVSCQTKHEDQPKNLKSSEKNLSAWTNEDARQYNEDQFDETKWNMELLENELSYVGLESWPTQTPISHIPFPVAKYGPGYQGYISKPLSLQIDDKIIKGGAFAVSTNDKSIEPKHDLNRSNFVFFNILVLTDKPENENGLMSVLSRNYPHHTCQGRRKTSIGNIDWFAMHLATSVKMAIVNSKYFNLDFGQTILVAPQKDKSIRFMQIELPTLSTNEIKEEIIRLSEAKDVIDFFTDVNNI